MQLNTDQTSINNPELGAKLKWNSEADDFNQWDSLGGDEKAELIAASVNGGCPPMPCCATTTNTTK